MNIKHENSLDTLYSSQSTNLNKQPFQNLSILTITVQIFQLKQILKTKPLKSKCNHKCLFSFRETNFIKANA